MQFSATSGCSPVCGDKFGMVAEERGIPGAVRGMAFAIALTVRSVERNLSCTRRNSTRASRWPPRSARSRRRPRSRPTPARPGTGVIDWLALSSDWRYQLAGVIDEPVLSISQHYRPALKHAVPTARVSPAHPNPRAHAAHAPDSTQARNAAPQASRHLDADGPSHQW